MSSRLSFSAFRATRYRGGTTLSLAGFNPPFAQGGEDCAGGAASARCRYGRVVINRGFHHVVLNQFARYWLQAAPVGWRQPSYESNWIPAYAGMTRRGRRNRATPLLNPGRLTL
jgi:hypothetical protein